MFFPANAAAPLWAIHGELTRKTFAQTEFFFLSALDAGDFESFGKLQFGARKKVMQEWLQMATHRLKIAFLPFRKCRADGGPKQSKRVSTLGYLDALPRLRPLPDRSRGPD
jgi:hypothetical protein